MGLFLPWTVQAVEGSRLRCAGEFRCLDTAITAARGTLDDVRVVFAVVRDLDGRMVFAVDRQREWAEVMPMR